VRRSFAFAVFGLVGDSTDGRARRLDAPPSDRSLRAPGLFTRMKGGSCHDGRFRDLGTVIDHCKGHFKLHLTTNGEAGSDRVPEVAVTVFKSQTTGLSRWMHGGAG
jgi:hypothetical protein